MDYGVLRCHALIAVFKAKSSSVAVCRREQDDRQCGPDVDGVDSLQNLNLNYSELWEL